MNITDILDRKAWRHIYYEERDIILLHGDSYKLVTYFPDSMACLADPPYGNDYDPRHFNRRRSKWCRASNFDPIAGNGVLFDPAPFLRFHKVALWGGQYYADKLPASRGWLVWDKREGTQSDSHADCEMAWTNVDMPTRLYSHLWRGICRRGEENISKGSRRVHPNQKPVALMAWEIQQLKLTPKDSILDTHCGSGSMAVAAKRAGIPYVGIDIESKWLDLSIGRLRQEILNFA